MPADFFRIVEKQEAVRYRLSVFLLVFDKNDGQLALKHRA